MLPAGTARLYPRGLASLFSFRNADFGSGHCPPPPHEYQRYGSEHKPEHTRDLPADIHSRQRHKRMRTRHSPDEARLQKLPDEVHYEEHDEQPRAPPEGLRLL